jgi:ABC-type branched-subunit amino acid transport system ATPase component
MPVNNGNAGGAYLLEAAEVTKHFMGVTALNEVDITIRPGELVSLIGPNGSGKTTFFNCVSGFLKQDGGRVLFRGQEITNWRPDRIARLGLRRTFQDVRNFPAMSVLENLLTAIQQHQEENLLARALRTPGIRRFEEEALARAYQLLELIGFPHLAHHPAGGLSYGQRKLLEFASALMPDPDLILLDEPAAAVAGEMIDKMKALILELHAGGKTFLIVEHNMTVVMDISQRIVVLDHGQKIAEGTPAEIRSNERVLEAYFGR